MKDFDLKDYEAVIFDLDGSLVDSMWMWKAIDIEYLASHGIKAPASLQKDIGGRSFVETAIYFKERFNLADSVEKIGDDWNKMAWDKYTNEVPLKEGVMAFLDKCEELGIKLGIASSNSTELIEQVLESHGIMDKFKSIKSGTQVVKGKPAPDIFLTCAELMKCRPEDCFVIEDSYNGIRAAKNAGMHPIMVPDQMPPNEEMKSLAEAVLDDLQQVRGYLEDAWKRL